MLRELLVGGQRFIVHDPNHSLMPLMEYDQVARHDAPDVVKGIRDIERQNAVEPMPNNCDPMGAIRGRGRMYEGIVGGNYKGWALVFAWFYFGTPALIGYVFTLCTIMGNFAQSSRNYPGAGDGLAIILLLASPSTFFLYLLWLGTSAWLAKRRTSCAPPFLP
jgi:hypothetical protein